MKLLEKGGEGKQQRGGVRRMGQVEDLGGL